MSEPFLAEIRIVGFNFAPRGWAFCDGQILPINQNQSLYSLLGTTYGGDGSNTFALPELRGRVPIHEGRDTGMIYSLGEKGGVETHTLTLNEMPQHNHEVVVSNAEGTLSTPSGNYFGRSTDLMYRKPSTTDASTSSYLSNIGGGQSHENMQPYLALNFCIALQGLFPSRN